MTVERRPSRNLGIVAVIIVIAISLSLVSYQYSQYSAAQIEQISTSDTRSNAEIQSYDLANSLAIKLEDITRILQVISASRSIQEVDSSRAAPMLNEAQLASSDLVDFYMWLDKDGRVVWISNINQTQYEQYRGLDLGYRLYFSEPKATHDVYYSSIVDSNDRINRIYISFPIMGSNASGQDGPFASTDSLHDGDFKGIVVAGIRAEILGKYLENQISPKLKSQVGLLDHTGIILYSPSVEYDGKNVFGVRFQSFLQSFGSKTADAMSSGFKMALQGRPGAEDIAVNGRSAFVYSPVLIEGKQFGVVYIIAPYAQAAEVTALVESQKNLSILIIVAIASSAITAAIVILRWNKELGKTIAQRTSQLREANEQLMVHDKLQKEFINIAAHELRTPVQPILGMSEILETEFGEQREDIRLIARNARRLERLTQDILDVSKIESGSLALDKQPIDLGDVVSSVVIDYQSHPERGGGTSSGKVKIRYEPKNVLLEADKARIQQVMSNLISNALKFTKEGEIIIKIEENNDFVQVTVQDTGSGIDPEIKPRLFQKFASKSEKGTGLGLYISNSIVQAHGGKMWADNNVDGKGALFSFSLPAGIDEDAHIK